MKRVYIPKMITKLEQGVGRLIRSDSDKGIVCCLDARISRYLNDVKRALLIGNFTTNIDDVYEFSDKYITLCKNDK